MDYQEKSHDETAPRWLDRLTPDGSWSGNLFDFFQRVLRKLQADLKVPFRLEGAVRIDSTPIHETLREALTNTLIHADFTGRTAVLVEKYPDRFLFRNPGLMRVPIEQAIEGGNSDCRNRTLQKLFRLAGFGDQAGSGVPKIWKSWREQHWQPPFLMEEREHEFTRLELRMISLIPPEIHQYLLELYGNKYQSLQELDRIILVTAAMEKTINHDRIKQLSTEHPRDISAHFARLVQEGFLVTQGETRARVYSLSEGFEANRSEKSSEKSSEKIIALMRKNKEVSAAEIAQYLELSTRAVEKQIAKLKAEGIIQRIGPDKGGYWEVLEKS